jgi:predicted ArsR family transcriptional regulator
MVTEMPQPATTAQRIAAVLLAANEPLTVRQIATAADVDLMSARNRAHAFTARGYANRLSAPRLFGPPVAVFILTSAGRDALAGQVGR